MSEKKARGKKSDPPPGEGAELKAQRDAFLHTFFRRGAELTEELMRENERLRKELARMETENAALKRQLRSDDAIRELLKKIDELEREKQALLSSWQEAEQVTGRFADRFQEIESELENFANLYVASYQLHSSLRLPVVVKHLKELLMQLIGARAVSFYLVNDAKTELFPVAAEGISDVPVVRLRDEGASGAAAMVERVFLTGVPYVIEGDVKKASAAQPAACVPMRFEEEAVGVIVIYQMLEQKKELVPVDHELIKLLGAHAGTALVSARLYAEAGEKIPTLEPLRGMPR